MLIFIAIFALSQGALAAPQNGEERIVGGQYGKIADFPYQVSLREKISEKTAFHVCGASILSDKAVLTAAHCTYDKTARDLVVVVGKSTLDDTHETHGTQVVLIRQHPLYKPPPKYDYDVAVLILITGLGINNKNIAPIQLPTRDLMEDEKVVVSGWGKLDEHDEDETTNDLRFVEIFTFKQDECSLYYPTRITDNMVCAGVREGGKDSCTNDSGGPLVKDGVQYGIVSWGWGCARPKQPGVYIRVYKFLPFIKDALSFA